MESYDVPLFKKKMKQMLKFVLEEKKLGSQQTT